MAKSNTRRKGESKREYAARINGGNKNDYDSNGNKKKGSSNKDALKAILASTLAQPKTLDTFEQTYTKKQEAQDTADATALYTPWFQLKIKNELEDLNSWSQSENTDYNRNLRRARISLASTGGAIGSERTTVEGEISTDHTAKVNDTLRGYERMIGTEALTGAGYQSQGQQEGSAVQQMKEAIQSGQLDYKNQRANRYFGDTNRYYSQPTNVSLAGTTM